MILYSSSIHISGRSPLRQRFVDVKNSNVDLTRSTNDVEVCPPSQGLQSLTLFRDCLLTAVTMQVRCYLNRTKVELAGLIFIRELTQAVSHELRFDGNRYRRNATTGYGTIVLSATFERLCGGAIQLRTHIHHIILSSHHPFTHSALTNVTAV